MVFAAQKGRPAGITIQPASALPILSRLVTVFAAQKGRPAALIMSVSAMAQTSRLVTVFAAQKGRPVVLESAHVLMVNLPVEVPAVQQKRRV